MKQPKEGESFKRMKNTKTEMNKFPAVLRNNTVA